MFIKIKEVIIAVDSIRNIEMLGGTDIIVHYKNPTVPSDYNRFSFNNPTEANAELNKIYELLTEK